MARQRFPAHRFDWPPQIIFALRSHVEHAIRRVRPSGYEQEPAYVAALIARLDGVVYEGPEGRIELVGTIVNDRGPNSAEKKWGADFAITASLSQGRLKRNKAVLGQAKRGPIEDLDTSEHVMLDEQCRKMQSMTDSCLIMATPAGEFANFPHGPIVRIVSDNESPVMSLADYLSDKLIECQHGDTRDDFVIKAMTSRLTALHLSIEA